MSNSSLELSDPVEGSLLKKRLRRRSEVWDHFEERPDRQRVICKYCGNDLVAKSIAGTTHLKRHLENCNKRPQDVDQPLTMGIRNEVRKFGWTNEKTWEVEVKKAILAEVPFAPPNCQKAFSNLMGLMDMDKEICCYYEHEKEKLANEFKDLSSRVCISYEIMEKLNYISITAHFINEDFNLVKKLIGFKKLTDISSRSCVVHTIEKCISDWKLGDKIFSFTGKDYSEYVSKSMGECFPPKRFLEDQYFHVPCNRRELAMCYYDELGPLSFLENTENIKNLTKAMKVVHCQMDAFNQIAKERSLRPINENWLNQYAEISWDWNSEVLDPEQMEHAFKLFKEAIPYKDIFIQYAKINSGRLAKGHKGCLNLENQGCNELDIANLSNLCTCTELSTSFLYDIDWETLEATIKLSDKFHEFIDRMASFNFPTSNLCFPIFAEIEDITMNDKFCLRLMTEDIIHVCGYAMWNKVINVACVLDPRYKLIFLEYCFEKTKDELEFPEERINEIWELLKQNFGAYVKGKTTEFANPTRKKKVAQGILLSYPLIDGFSMYTKELKKKIRKSELEEYLDDEVVDLSEASFNLLGWWKQNRLRYPVLSRMARDFLAVPTCAYRIESNISSEFRILQEASPQLVEVVICSKDWILSDVQSIPEQKN